MLIPRKGNNREQKKERERETQVGNKQDDDVEVSSSEQRSPTKGRP